MSRLNVIFSKFDEVQRSGNMVLSPMSGKVTFPVIFVFFLAKAWFGFGEVVVTTWFVFGGACRHQHVTLESAHSLHSFFLNSFPKIQLCTCPDQISPFTSHTFVNLQHSFMPFLGCFFSFFPNWC